jgi:hypothetical protein
MNFCTVVTAALPPRAPSAKTEAEATAFIICHAAGLENGSAACDYVAVEIM